jgi:hypothetical protein
VQDALSPLQDGKGDVIGDPSGQAWFEKSIFAGCRRPYKLTPSRGHPAEVGDYASADAEQYQRHEWEICVLLAVNQWATGAQASAVVKVTVESKSVALPSFWEDFDREVCRNISNEIPRIERL